MDTNRDATVETVDMGDADDTDKKDDKKSGRGCGCWIALILVLLAGAGGGAYVGATTLFRTEKPLPLEREAADLMKRWLMVPGEFADRRIPDRASVNVATGRKLFIEGEFQGREFVGCALCHGEAGLGDTKLGASMYPPASNLASPSNVSKSDGQLFWLIAHGINLTGMPAFGEGYMPYGKGYTEDEIWSLVKYIREDIQKQK